MFDPDKLDARTLEEAFHCVRIHLEGTDHSVRFPDYLTGKFENLDLNAIFTLYGHPYDQEEIWKPKKVLPQRSTKQEMIKVDTEGEIISGTLKMRREKWYGKETWNEYWFVLKYPVLECYKTKGDEKPFKMLELQWEEEEEDEESIFTKLWHKISKKEENDSQNGEKLEDANENQEEEKEKEPEKESAEVCLFKEKQNAFQIESKEENWELEASNYQSREEWMGWIKATSIFDPKIYEKQQEKKKRLKRNPKNNKKEKKKKKEKEQPQQKKKKQQLTNGSVMEIKKKKSSKKETKEEIVHVEVEVEDVEVEESPKVSQKSTKTKKNKRRTTDE